MQDNQDFDEYVVEARNGRDAGKRFHVQRIDALTRAGYMLRFVSAVHVESWETLIEDLKTAADRENGAPIDEIMNILHGSDPAQIHKLITDLLGHVRVSPDPAHPDVRRAMQRDDIAELPTLGDVLMGVYLFNFKTGA